MRAAAKTTAAYPSVPFGELDLRDTDACVRYYEANGVTESELRMMLNSQATDKLAKLSRRWKLRAVVIPADF